MGTLKHKTASGVKWQVVAQVTSKVISVTTFAILARMLTPDAFGLFSLAFVAIDGLGMFKAFGIDAGIIQRREANTTRVTSTAFYMVQATGLVTFLFCLALAPLAGIFFKNPGAVAVIQSLGIVFITNGFGKVPSALLTKEMRFNLTGVIQLIGAVVNSVCAIGFAKISPSVWSLVLAYVAKALVMDILAWYFSKFRLTWEFDKQIAKEFFRFGGLLMSGSIFGFITENLNNVTVGRLLGTTRVGYLALANNIAAFVNTHFTYLILRVLFPAYASINHDKSEVRRVFLKITKFIAIFTLPFCTGLFLVSKELVLTVYGPRWDMIIPVVKVTAMIQLAASIFSGMGPLYMAIGRPKYLLHLAIAGLVVRVPLVVVFTQRWGLMGTVVSDLLTNLILGGINLVLLRRSIGFTLKEFFATLRPAIIATVVMSGAVLGLQALLPHLSVQLIVKGRNLFQLAVLGAAGALVYGAVFFLIDRPAVKEIKELILKKKGQ